MGLNSASPPSANAAWKLLRTYYYRPRYVRWFSRIRAWHASYHKIEKEVPRQGLIYDLGCGYGIFSNYLALTSHERRIIGIENNQRKLQYCDKSLSSVTFLAKAIGECRMESCRGIVLLDLLHHLSSYEEQETLINKCLSALEKTGRIIIKEIDLTLGWKYHFTALIDRMLYPGEHFFFRAPQEFEQLLVKMGTAKTRIIPLALGPLAHTMIVGEK